jgi:hypothetical protein
MYISWIMLLFVFHFLLLIFRLFVRLLFIQCIYWRRNVLLFYRRKQNRSRWIYRIKRACFVAKQYLVLRLAALWLWGVYKIWHCQSWPSYTVVYEYSKKIYLLTNISLCKKSITVQKSFMNVIKNIYIFTMDMTTAIWIIISSTSNTVFSSKNDGIK